MERKETEEEYEAGGGSREWDEKVSMFPFLSYDLANKDRSMEGMVFALFIDGEQVESRR
jgi:hypothetical protein